MAAHPTERAAVLGSGACTPIGLTLKPAFAAARAGLVAFTEQALEPDGAGGMACISPVAVPQLGTSARQRMSALGVRALRDLAAGLDPSCTPGRLALCIGFPSAQQFCEAEAHDVTQVLQAETARLFGREPVLTFTAPRGRSAFFFALAAALQTLNDGRCDAALVGATDSLCAPEVLQALRAAGRLAGDDHVDSVIPGEGAAFVLLGRPHNGAETVIVGNAIDRDAHHFQQDLPNTAVALTTTLRTLRQLPALAGRRIDLMLSCETGERFWTDELSMAYLRNLSLMPEPYVRSMVAESFGDLGAASGAVQLAMGLEGLTRVAPSGLPRQWLLVCGSSDDGHVGACVAHRPLPATTPLGTAR